MWAKAGGISPAPYSKRLFWPPGPGFYSYLNGLTNNLAEQDIRPLVVWRKSSQGSRSVRGERFIERIQTVNQTCRKQNKNPFQFIQNTLVAYWANTKSPALLP